MSYLKFITFVLLFFYVESASAQKAVLDTPCTLVWNGETYATSAQKSSKIIGLDFITRFFVVNKNCELSKLRFKVGSPYIDRSTAYSNLPKGFSLVDNPYIPPIVEPPGEDSIIDDYLKVIERNLLVDELPHDNYINWEDFKDVETEANTWLGYGQLPQFSADLGGNSLLSDKPQAIKKGFVNVGWTDTYANTSRAYKVVEMASHIPTGRQKHEHGWAETAGLSYVRDNPSAGSEVGYFLWDNEGEGMYEWFFNTYAAKGAIDWAATNGNETFTWIDYHGLDILNFTRISNYYYKGGGDVRLWNWPFFDNSYGEDYETINNRAIFDGLEYKQHNYLKTISNYYPESIPSDVSLYQKENGKILLDDWGDRLIKSEDIKGRLRGEEFYLRTVGQRDENGLLKPCYNNSKTGWIPLNGGCIGNGTEYLLYQRHQGWVAINSLSANVALNINHLIARNKKQFGSDDITEYREDATWDYLPILRDRTETRPWGEGKWHSHPIGSYQINTWFFQSQILFGRGQIWTGYGNREPKPMGEKPTVYEVDAGGLIEKDFNLGQVSNLTGGLHYIEHLHSEYNLFSDDDKILVFMQPSEVQNGEIIALGRLNGNNLFVILAEPRLDIGETMSVTISNMENFAKYERTIEARRLDRFVVELPPSKDSYEASEITISYVPLKRKDNGEYRPFVLSGDLIKHVVSK